MEFIGGGSIITPKIGYKIISQNVITSLQICFTLYKTAQTTYTSEIAASDVCQNPSPKKYGSYLSSGFESISQFNNLTKPLKTEHLKNFFLTEFQQAMWNIAQLNPSIKPKLYRRCGASFSLQQVLSLDLVYLGCCLQSHFRQN